MTAMPTIRVSDDVLKAIEAEGRFGDTHDSVLRRKYSLSIEQRSRAKRGTGTPRQRYRPLILKYLRGQPDGADLAANVLSHLEREMEPQFVPEDFETLSGGVSRWSNRAQWERQSMVDDGLLEDAGRSGRGTWKLTEKGLDEAKKL